MKNPQKSKQSIPRKDCFQVSQCHLLTISPPMLSSALHSLKRCKLRYVIKQVGHDRLRLAVFLNLLSFQHRKRWKRFAVAVAV
jgi:hypothetical protein